MKRRAFVRLLAASAQAMASLDVAAKQRRRAGAPLVGTVKSRPNVPAVRVVSSFAVAKSPGMPGLYPGRVVSVKSEKCVDTSTGAANDEVVREMLSRGMRVLTGAGTTGTMPSSKRTLCSAHARRSFLSAATRTAAS